MKDNFGNIRTGEFILGMAKELLSEDIEFNLTSKLCDLGFSSLQIMSLMACVNTEYSIDFPIEIIENSMTLDSIAREVNKILFLREVCCQPAEIVGSGEILKF